MKRNIQSHWFIICLILFCYPVLTSFISPTDDTTESALPFRVRTIVIDAGHGGKDPGTHGAYSNEKSVALAIAKKLRDAINDQLPNIKVIMTRADNTFIPLNQRSEIANDHHANLFISIHCNSTPERVGHQKGAMVLIYSLHRKGEQMEALRENASIYQEKNYKETYESYSENDPANLIILNTYMQKYRKQSILFGDLLMDQLKSTGNQAILGVKEQSVLVLAHSAMPAILFETGFLNNPSEEDYLNSESGQNEIVRAIIRAIKEYKNEIDSK